MAIRRDSTKRRPDDAGSRRARKGLLPSISNMLVLIVRVVKLWEPTTISRLFRLFLVAFSPLTLIIAIKTSHHCTAKDLQMYVFWISATLATVGFIDAWRLPRGALRKGSIKREFYDIQDPSGAVAAYLATYLLPFMSLQIGTIRDVVAVVVFFLVVLAIFLTSDLAAINPTLYVFGWRVVRARVKSSDGNDPMVVVLLRSKTHLSPGQRVPVVRFGNFLVRK